MQIIAGAFLHLWQGEEFRLWSHLSPLKCAEVLPSGVQLRRRLNYGWLIMENQHKRKAFEEAIGVLMLVYKSLPAGMIHKIHLQLVLQGRLDLI